MDGTLADPAAGSLSRGAAVKGKFTAGDATIGGGGNVEASAGWFVDAAAGDLHLAPGAAGAIDQAEPLTAPGVTDDVDGDARPGGGADDVGADER